jgi:hypothetical protein
MLRLLAIDASLLALVVAGLFALSGIRSSPNVPPEETAFQLPPPCTDPREPEPQAVEARLAVICRDAARIYAECQRATSGDWGKWQRDTEPNRAALRTRVEALKSRSFPGVGMPEYRYQPLAPLDDFPLFQVGPREHISYLYDPKQMELPLGIPKVVAADRWLKRQGIDLIFVPVPKMVEIYAEHFVATPADGIIAPHVRRALLGLLNSDVETVDGLALFRAARNRGYLYNAADSHWAPAGMQVMAEEIARRLARYEFGARARQAARIVFTAETPYILDAAPGGVNAGPWLILSKEQQARARTAQATTLQQAYASKDCVVQSDPASPVLVVGNSYVRYFLEQVMKESNLIVAANQGGGMTTEWSGSLIREPEVLKQTRVIIWVTTTQHLSHFKPLPPPILAAASTSAPSASPPPGPSSRP